MFQAAATAVALFEIANERAVFERKREHRLEWKLEWARKVFAQMAVDFVMMPVRLGPIGENFARIENVFRIESAFDLAHDSEQLLAELVVHVFGACDADAMLGRKRTFELPDKRGGLIGNLPEFLQIGCAVQIEHWTNMEQSTGGMPVVAGLQSKRLHD